MSVAETAGAGRAEVPDEHRVVVQWRAAAAAVLGIGGVGEGLQRDGVVLDAEVQDPVAPGAEVCDERVVGVEDEARAGQLVEHAGPPLGDRLELPVAVELIAEEVGEQQRARAQLRRDAIEPELVDLEQADVPVDPAAAGGVEQRAGHPAGHVRPLHVVHHAPVRAREDRGHDRGGRRLAVRRRDRRAAVRQPGGERRDRVRLQAQQHLAGQRGAAAAGAPRQRAGGAGGGELRADHGTGQRTGTAWGTQEIVTGVAPIGSPSA